MRDKRSNEKKLKIGKIPRVDKIQTKLLNSPQDTVVEKLGKVTKLILGKKTLRKIWRESVNQIV